MPAYHYVAINPVGREQKGVIEFVDGNRGVFLIPNNPASLRQFLSDYFAQGIYANFKFNTVQVENYIDTEQVNLSPSTKLRLSLARKRIE